MRTSVRVDGSRRFSRSAAETGINDTGCKLTGVSDSATLEFAIFSGAMKIHYLSIEEAFSSMQSAPSGLTSQEARRRLVEYGPNDVEKVPRQPLLLTFSCQETKSLRQNPAGKSRPRH
jgi:hypothetical protein